MQLQQLLSLIAGSFETLVLEKRKYLRVHFESRRITHDRGLVADRIEAIGYSFKY